jgi:hypothetical protein
VSRNAVHGVSGAIISPRAKANYFDLRLRDSVQDSWKKWFYIMDEKSADQNYGLAPFDSTAEVQKL